MSTNLVLHFHAVPSIDWFRNALNGIRCLYKFIPAENIVSYYRDGKKFNSCCHICFDDGDRTFYDNAFPVLKETNIPATLFVSPKIISNGCNYWFQDLSYISNRLNDASLKEVICDVFDCKYAQIEKYMVLSLFKCMKIRDIFKVMEALKKKHSINVDNKQNITISELRELGSSNLIMIGAHTMNHPILSNETNEDAEKEIRESINMLSQILEKEVRYFSYPNGVTGLDYGMREKLMLSENKVKLSFSTDSGFFGEKTDLLSFPRHGFGSLEREDSVRILGRLMFLPIWDILRNMSKPERIDIRERRERKEIKDLRIL